MREKETEIHKEKFEKWKQISKFFFFFNRGLHFFIPTKIHRLHSACKLHWKSVTGKAKSQENWIHQNSPHLGKKITDLTCGKGRHYPSSISAAYKCFPFLEPIPQ
jgi:hypothetical protein